MWAERWGQDGLGGRAPRVEQVGDRALRLEQTWKVANRENILHKLPLGKNPLGKYLTSIKVTSLFELHDFEFMGELRTSQTVFGNQLLLQNISSLLHSDSV